MKTMKIIVCNECRGINAADGDPRRCPRCGSDSVVDYVLKAEIEHLITRIVVINSFYFSAVLLLLCLFR